MPKPLVFFLFLTALAGLAADRPNILYLYVDDMGWGSIGPNGQAERRARGLPHVLTPNLDRLAAGGVNFRRGYGCTVCSPARSSQQTGFHQGHTFADRNDPNNAKKAIRADDLTMGDLLSKAGYTTGYWGKWGYGGSKDMQSPTIDNVQTLPTSHGYKHVVAELHHVRAHTFFQPTLWTAPTTKDALGGMILSRNSMAPYANKRYPDYPARQNHPKYPQTAYCDDVYAMAALDFVRAGAAEYNQSGKPFFGLFAAQIPHAPFAEVAKLPNWDEAYRDKPYFKKLAAQSQQWCAMVTRIDAHFGNLLAALEDPNGDGDKSDSVAANTLVVFQSDNGGPGGKNRAELAANGPLSGNKGSILEGGIRVPTIMRWPAKITPTAKLKAGTSTNFVVDCTDLLPTFCDLAGIAPPVGLDGVSIAPTLTGQGTQRPRPYLIHEAGAQASIIRGDYKLIINRGGKKQRSRNARLHNLAKDPAEKTNLADKYPVVVEELTALLLAERVTEPAGFANTYRTWTGTQNANFADSANWADYVYANAGITYMTAKGTPDAAAIVHVGPGAKVNVNTDAEVLGLALSGTAKQPTTVTVPGTVLTARNELRVGANAKLAITKGQVVSNRWLEVAGELHAVGARLAADYYQQENATLHALLSAKRPPLSIQGAARLDGTLHCFSPNPPTGPTVILQADTITGKFTNQTVRIGDRDYAIDYQGTTVLIVPN